MADANPTPLPTADPKVLARFLAKVDRAGECWLWTGGTKSHGYANFKLGVKSLRAHRVAWTLFLGPIPPGLCVLHRCDVRACIRPDHLFLGTHAENMGDMVAKGRQATAATHPGRWASGEHHGSRTSPGRMRRGPHLTVADVLAIRASDEPLRVMSARFGVGVANVKKIRRRVTWKHV